MKNKLRIAVSIAALALLVTGCGSKEEKTQASVFTESVDLGESVEDSKVIGETEVDATQDAAAWEVVSYETVDGLPTLTYKVAGLEKTLVPNLYYEPEWLEGDFGYVVGDTDADGDISDDYFVCDYDDDGVDELMVGSIVFGNNVTSDYGTFVIYELGESGELVETTNYACFDLFGGSPCVKDNRFVVTQYYYNGQELEGKEVHFGYYEGRFVDGDYFPNWIQISWDEQYKEAEVCISIYKEMTFNGKGHMENGVLKFVGMSEEENPQEATADFYLWEEGYEIFFTACPYPTIRTEEPYSGMYEQRETTAQENHINVNVYYGELSFENGVYSLTGTISDAFGLDAFHEGEDFTMNFDMDTVLENPEMLDHGEAGDNAITWLERLSGDETAMVAGVYDIYVTGNHVDKVVGLYWWD